MTRLEAAVSALRDVDVSAWPEATLTEQLGELVGRAGRRWTASCPGSPTAVRPVACSVDEPVAGLTRIAGVVAPARPEGGPTGSAGLERARTGDGRVHRLPVG